MCIILCLESNRLGYMNPKGHRDWVQVLRVSEHRSKTYSVQIISICHDFVMESRGWIL